MVVARSGPDPFVHAEQTGKADEAGEALGVPLEKRHPSMPAPLPGRRAEADTRAARTPCRQAASAGRVGASLSAWPASAFAAALLCALPSLAHAQLFLASHADPPFTIGPLFVRASIGPQLGPVPVDVFWGLVYPPGRGVSPVADDLYMLWPNAVTGEAKAGKPDPDLARYVEARGLTAIDDGRLSLAVRNVRQMGRDQPAESVAGGASFVTFVRQGGPLGLTSPATYIRIPWTPKLADRDSLVHLRLTIPNLIKLSKASWIETLVGGERHRLAISFHDVRGRALFPLYLEQRNRVLRLADEPSQLLINFASADRLKIIEVSPPSSSRRLSESLENTQVVSLFLGRSEGLTPQILTVQFAYFSRIQTWAPILLPTLFFVLGNLAAVFVRTAADRLSKRLAGRVMLGPAKDGPGGRQTGVVLPRDTLERIAPGVTTYEQVLHLCGPDAEHVEQFPVADRRTLVYRGRRVVPQRRRRFGWLTTVSHWDVEHHEVEIELEHDVVRDVRAHVRRARLDRFQPG